LKASDTKFFISSKMNSQDNADKEQELRERELALRLRELELELHATLNNQDNQDTAIENLEPPKRALKTGMRDFIKWAKIIGCFCVGLIFVYVGALLAIWVAITVLISTLCYLGYLLFWPKTHSRP
jgi:Flp pilus assembly protein TadB